MAKKENSAENFGKNDEFGQNFGQNLGETNKIFGKKKFIKAKIDIFLAKIWPKTLYFGQILAKILAKNVIFETIHPPHIYDHVEQQFSFPCRSLLKLR